MSNKAVPTAYRTIIEQVMRNVRLDFDEMGIEDAVISELQRSWESKVVATRVADFSLDERLSQYPSTKQIKPEPDAEPSQNGGFRRSSGSPEVDVKPELDTNGNIIPPGASQKQPRRGAKERAPDDDEIGSDLDDPDEEDVNDDNEADGGDLVIALYDKVQRVKNKWKITLKDGVVSVKGKDYLFSKCQGEFEW